MTARHIKFFLAVLGSLSLITFVMPVIVTVLLISIVGLPLAAILMAAPLLLLFCLGGWAGQRFINGSLLASLAGAAFMGGLLIMFASAANGLLDRRAADLTEDDRTVLAEPLKVRVLALRSDRPRAGSKGETQCDEVCQRILLNGTVDQVLIVDEPDIGRPPDAMAEALSYRMEDRAECPALILASGGWKLRPKAEDMPLSGGREPPISCGSALHPAIA